MATSIPEKLRISEGMILLTKNAPGGFKKTLGKLPSNVKMVTSGKTADQVHWFVTNRAQLEKEMSNVMKVLREGMIVWVYYPKGSSGVQTDLTRDKGWDCLLAESARLTWINLISFDETWSVVGFRVKTEADRIRESKPKPEREIFKWVDPVTKQVKLPEDLVAAFRKHKSAGDAFNALAFSHKKEYIEWIVTAKREETRADRIKGTIERIERGWKNPRNN